jgi:hypothetical protein
MARYRVTVAVFALLALTLLVARPTLLDAVGIPYGVPGSPAMEIVRADGSAHCEMLSDCHTISVGNIGLNLGVYVLLPMVVAGLAVAGLRRPRKLCSWASPVVNRPPILLTV